MGLPMMFVAKRSASMLVNVRFVRPVGTDEEFDGGGRATLRMTLSFVRTEKFHEDAG